MREQISEINRFRKEMLSILKNLKNKDWALDELTSLEDPFYEQIENIGKSLRRAFKNVLEACDNLKSLAEEMTTEYNDEMSFCDNRAMQVIDLKETDGKIRAIK